MREVLVVAGEASGELHAAGFASALRQRRPDVELVGVGGAAMDSAGVRLLERTDTLAVMGFAEVLRQIPHHYRLLKTLGARLLSGKVALVVLVDYPGFNMRLGRLASRAGVPVLYYITPQVWAWGANRLPQLAQIITRAAVILPFEAPLLRGAGIDATFVGHPLLDRAGELPDRAAARTALSLAPDATVLALFPGSRRQEIARHLDEFVATARRLEQSIPNLRVIVSVAPGITIEPSRCAYRRVANQSQTVLRAADAALCKSGTVTLEAAVAGCPLVIAYRTSRLTYALARRVVRIPHIGLVNVVAGREVAPEFVQGEMRADAMAAALEPLLSEPSSERRTMLEGLRAVRAQLGNAGAAARVAELADTLVPA
ncbi:MAG: lipid-A-disaccharide synthase [Gemmatimonadaceae bacterium]